MVAMVALIFARPHWGERERIRRHGRTRQGSEGLGCTECRRAFTPHPKSRSLGAEKEQLILKALAHKAPIVGIARTLGVG